MAWHISFLLAFHDLLFLTDSRRDCVSCWWSLDSIWFIASSIIWSFGSTPIMWLWTTQHANTTFTWVGKDQNGSASNTQKRFFNTPNPRSMVVLNEKCWRLNNSCAFSGGRSLNYFSSDIAHSDKVTIFHFYYHTQHHQDNIYLHILQNKTKSLLCVGKHTIFIKLIKIQGEVIV